MSAWNGFLDRHSAHFGMLHAILSSTLAPDTPGGRPRPPWANFSKSTFSVVEVTLLKLLIDVGGHFPRRRNTVFRHYGRHDDVIKI